MGSFGNAAVGPYRVVMKDSAHSASDPERGQAIPLDEAIASIREEPPKRIHVIRSLDQKILALPLQLYAFVLERVGSGMFPDTSSFVFAVICFPIDEQSRRYADGSRCR